MRQLIRFGVVGCANFGISYTVFFLAYRYWPFSTLLTVWPASLAGGMLAALRSLGVSSIDAAVANLLGFVAGMANSFIWNKIWTFQAREGTRQQARRFIITNLLCLAISTMCIFIGTDVNHLPYNLVWFVTMAFVTGINFVMSKRWVFA